MHDVAVLLGHHVHVALQQIITTACIAQRTPPANEQLDRAFACRDDNSTMASARAGMRINGYLDDYGGRMLAAAAAGALDDNVAHAVLLPGQLALVRKVLEPLQYPAQHAAGAIAEHGCTCIECRWTMGPGTGLRTRAHALAQMHASDES